MKTILSDPYIAALTILLTQMLFIYLRTLNVIYTTKGKLIPAIITGNGIGLASLFAMAIGGNSIIRGDFLPIIAFLIGGSIGQYLGMKKEKSNEN